MGNMLVIVNDILKDTVNKEVLAYSSKSLLEWLKVLQLLLLLYYDKSLDLPLVFHCFDHFWSSLLLLQCRLLCKGSNLLYLDVWRQIIAGVCLLDIINLYVFREGDAFFVLPNNWSNCTSFNNFSIIQFKNVFMHSLTDFSYLYEM